MNPIYTVTVYTKRGDEYRVYGWYADSVAAAERLVVHGGDLHECLYQYALIEQVPEGIYSTAVVMAWYKWENSTWVVMKGRPKWAHKYTVNYSIG